MKQLANILSVLIFTLSVVPCSDAATCDLDATASHASDHDHSEDREDNCTPFCICQCCSMTVYFEDAADPENIISDMFYHYSFWYTGMNNHDHLMRIWHPPTV